VFFPDPEDVEKGARRLLADEHYRIEERTG
jgi:hypothetical protein